MLRPFLAVAALAGLFALGAGASARMPGWAEIEQQQVVVQVPRMTITRTTVVTGTFRGPPPLVEKKADDCVKLEKITGFAVTRGDSVDLVMSDGKRLRARLSSNCPALGFYAGFYVKPHKDGKICAKRDTLRSRSGGSCGIDDFHRLVPAN